jgi:hypothetical protein
MGRHLVFTISVAILFGVCTVSASAKDFPCSDLRTAKAASLISILGTLPNANLDFSHGTGCYAEEEDEDSPKECDWKVTVDRDRNIADDRRLIVVDSDHMIGSGDWIDVLVLGCRAGKVMALFHDQFSDSVDVEEASADKLVLTFGRWVGSDPHCCPSMEEHQVYVWSKQAQKYVLDRDYSTPIAKP